MFSGAFPAGRAATRARFQGPSSCEVCPGRDGETARARFRSERPRQEAPTPGASRTRHRRSSSRSASPSRHAHVHGHPPLPGRSMGGRLVPSRACRGRRLGEPHRGRGPGPADAASLREQPWSL